MKKLIVILFFLPFTVWAQQDSILSGAFNWRQPVAKKNKVASIVLLQGIAHDFEVIQLSANTINRTTEIKEKVADGQEEVIIVKSGSATIHFGDSNFLLSAKSVAVLMPGEKFIIKNATNKRCDYYILRYRKKNSDDEKLFTAKSFVKIWENIPFKPNDIGGGRRDFFEGSTILQKRFEIHVSTLKEGIRSHEPHRHKAEEIVLMIDGDTEMQIGDQFKKVNAGGFYFLGSNVLHAIKNTGTKPSTYFAIQFE